MELVKVEDHDKKTELKGLDEEVVKQEEPNVVELSKVEDELAGKSWATHRAPAWPGWWGRSRASPGSRRWPPSPPPSSPAGASCARGAGAATSPSPPPWWSTSWCAGCRRRCRGWCQGRSRRAAAIRAKGRVGLAQTTKVIRRFVLLERI